MTVRCALVLVVASCGRLGFDASDRPIDAPSVTPDAFDTNYVFMTATTYSSSSLTLAQADSACNDRAAAAGLPGTYRAFLSTSAVNAVDRLTGARGWIRLDGKPVLDQPTDVATGRMYYPILYDDEGIAYPDGLGHFMTGSGSSGTLASNCGDFSGLSGNVLTGCANASSGFAGCANTGCGAMLRLACFGIDHAKPLVVPATMGRRAFVATGAFSSGMGIGAADAVCALSATNANVTGTFRALLATNTASAASRFSANGAPWIRGDGMALAPTAADFLAGKAELPLNIAFDGKFIGSSFVFTGAVAIDAVGSDPTDCVNWTVAGGNDTAVFGSANKIAPRNFNDPSLGGNCTFDSVVYCLED